jgi:glycerol-3-phosphate dehydrogenase
MAPRRKFLGNARRSENLGRDFGCSFSTCELERLVRAEWARTGEDVLWRSTKLGVHFNRETAAAVTNVLAELRAA